MHFGEIRAAALLAAVIAIAILLADRLAPLSVVAPGRQVTAAVTEAERMRADGNADEPYSTPATAPAGGGSGTALRGAITAAGYACPIVREVTPIDRRTGIYRIVCADRTNGSERSYRLDTRRGTTTVLETA